jgi:uncharacterized protein (DUF2249 family)
MIEMIINVTEIPPQNRHRQFFAAFDQLDVGDAIVLINDHDPRPLGYQLDSERRNTFQWAYVEQGPELWKVRVTKTAGDEAPKASHCCGSCGG